MTREELVHITNRLGYPYVWQDCHGNWNASMDMPLGDSNGWCTSYDDPLTFPISMDVNIEWEGSYKDSLLFYGDTLANTKEEQYTEAKARS